MSRSSMFGNSQFDQIQQRFQAAHGGGGRPQPSGQFVRPTHQDTILHSAGLRPALEGAYTLAAARERNKANSLLRQQSSLQQVNMLSWQAQKQITLLPPDNPSVAFKQLLTNRPQGSIVDWERERNLMYSQIKNLAKSLWNSYLNGWRFYEPANLKRIYVQPYVNITTKTVDGVAFMSLLTYISIRYPGSPFLLRNGEDEVLESDDVAKLFPSILLSDFTLGKGPDQRIFTLRDKIAKEFLTGYIIRSVLDGLYKEVNTLTPKGKISYKKFLTLKNNQAISYGLAFSPDLKSPSTWPESYRRHRDSNSTQLVIGGAMIYALPSAKPGWAVIEIKNAMSRRSFLLHAPVDNYKRNGDDSGPLSTIWQSFKFSIKIDPSKFPPDLDYLNYPDLLKPTKRLQVRPPWK